MTKETADIKIKKLKMETKPYDKVLAKVAELCPGAVQNGKVNFERLKAELSDVVDENTHETYEFKWVGKNASIVEANKPIRKTLRPCKEESKNWDTTENLYIEGDNLEVLKLLEEGYLGKVKMIYIDPPYNTGNDFVYHDNRVQSEEEMNKGIDLFDESNNRLLSKAFVRNKESNGRFHSDWCSMMYPRLKLARDLLSDDGVIFISIDDNEVANLKKICDEVFGENNHLGLITVVSNPRGRDYGGIAKMHDYILVYQKGENASLNLISDESNIFKTFDEFGGFELRELRNRNIKFNKQNRPNLYYPFYINKTEMDENSLYTISLEPHDNWIELFPLESQGINTVWRWGKEKSKQNLNINIKAKPMKNGSFMIVEKYREGRVMARSVWWDKDTNTEKGTLLLKNMFNGKIFDYPKTVEMLKKMGQMGTDSEADDIVLDFFSGSSTTAHAVMRLNAEDGGNRKFIMVQLPELTDEKSEAYKAGYKNICEIGKERIRRAGEKIKAEHPEATDLDIGFRVLKVADSNMRDVYYKPNELKQTDLLNSIDNIKSDRTPLDLLFGVMVEWGVSLSLPLKEIKVGNNTIHIVGDNDLVSCFDKDIDTETITKMAEQNPIRVIFRDFCFTKDDEKINMFEIFKTICHWDDEQAKNNIRVM